MMSNKLIKTYHEISPRVWFWDWGRYKYKNYINNIIYKKLVRIRSILGLEEDEDICTRNKEFYIKNNTTNKDRPLNI